jgi:mercuric ion binding protein
MKKYLLNLSGITLFVLIAIVGVKIIPTAQAEKALSQAVEVAETTAIFSIEKMTCAICPITVRKAMSNVEGVGSVKVNFSKKEATVIFDKSVTTIKAIGSASTNAGYPASIIAE